MDPFYALLARVQLQFETGDDDLVGALSAAVLAPEGHLWVGADEGRSLERLSPVATHVYGDHRSYALSDYLSLAEGDEIDIEGMDYSDGYLWFTGSHSVTRKKAKGKKPRKDLYRLAHIKREHNRFVLGRIPLHGGELCQACLPGRGDSSRTERRAGRVVRPESDDPADALVAYLSNDAILGPFLEHPFPSKENGFDIEGLAVHRDTVYLGLRGPVVQGWAMILQIQVEPAASGDLSLAELDGRHHRKHLVDLNGLGIRELCLMGDDLIILAGPTMDLDGALRLFRFRDFRDMHDESVTDQDSSRLEKIFDLPFVAGADNAEGLAVYPCQGEKDCLLVVYDEPHAERRPKSHIVYADVFRLK